MSRGAGRRHRGRRLALRVLFELEGTTRDAVEALRYQAQDEAAPADVVAYAAELVYGTLRNLEGIDDAISAASLNWRLEDIGKVERAVLRLGAFELLYESGVPSAVAIDECIELGRTYAGDESAPFVNGVLGRIAGGAE
ncbi:MAG TPA: transcription antitermination factor NusB [Candidatus Dormibacteraeota bacterium]|nr:transcription antitermination factor NusB [Candidatus Dormibacteraeota bacterium]